MQNNTAATNIEPSYKLHLKHNNVLDMHLTQQHAIQMNLALSSTNRFHKYIHTRLHYNQQCLYCCYHSNKHLN